MEDGFTGKVAFVTGGASGIGAVLCRSLAARGAKVAIADRDGMGAGRVAGELRAAGHSCLAIDLDVADERAVDAAIRKTTEALGELSLAVNNAGYSPRRAPLAEQTPEDWHACLAVNLSGVFYCMRSEVRAMLAGGGGSIVNVSSIAGVIAVMGTSPYTAAKHGVIGLTKAAALDYADQGIRINAVAPGYVDTPLLAPRSPSEREEITRRHPMRRLALADEIANLVLFLLSDQAGFITGSAHLVDGGYTAQ